MALETQAINFVAKQLSPIPTGSISAVIDLSKEGATIPFIARYRKERTGNLDEVQIRNILETFEQYNELVKRQAFVLKEIESQGNLTAELKSLIMATSDLADLEELYRPYKKKKKTKATEAREAGLEPLAQWIWDLGHGVVQDKTTLEVKAKDYINPSAKFATYDEALKGAQSILVERLANNPELRAMVLEDLLQKGKIQSRKGKGFKTHSKYEMYGEFDEPVKKLLEAKASHRYLAMRRGWQEGELTLTVESSDPAFLQKAYEKFALTEPKCLAADFLAETAKLALENSVLPSVTNEIHRRLKDTADGHAIDVFTENVRRLLLASPFGARCVLGIDPGVRTGCKVALLDKGGNFLTDTVIHVHGDGVEEKVETMFRELFSKMQVDAIAVGNGTGGREAEGFFRKVLKKMESTVPVVLINESGASVYSASEVAREEFPDLDITVRGAISIARRLQDPLAELVKIDPKSIGVGQYQHDVSPTKLKKSLDFVVESCVNSVGVDLNTASPYLMAYVSGIGPALAKGIAEHRKTNGLFDSREALLKVPRFSSKVFEQAAGFLRVPGSKNVLDQTGIHPERYSAVREMAHELGVNLSQLIGSGAKQLLEQRTKWVALVGEFTFDDIVRELEKPGRDPRDPFKTFSFRDDIFEVKDLKDGMICPGIVTNVTNFGAFVDIGVHQDGLVHISELSDKFVEDPRKVVNPGDQVQVRVLKVDKDKNQISLSMKMSDSGEKRPARSEERGPRPPRQERPQQRGARPQQDGRGAPRGPRPVDGRPPRDGGRAPGFGARGDRDSQPNGQANNQPNGRPAQRGPSQGRPMDKGGKERKPASPFNNSFGALANLMGNLPKK